MDILAHRIRTKPNQEGNSRENLMALYQMGITWIETDVMEIDGKIVIRHPSKYKPNLGVMTLFDLIKIISSIPGLHCCLDLKQNSRTLVSQVVRRIEQSGLHERIYLTTFQKRIKIPIILNKEDYLETSADLLLFAREICPNIRTHVIATWPWNLEKIVKKYQADAISFGWFLKPKMAYYISRTLFKLAATFRDLPNQIKKVKNQNIKVWAGICNDKKDMLYLAGLGIDGIMTDDPTLGIKIKQQLEKNSA